jgi:nitric-oxide synthase, bacterial
MRIRKAPDVLPNAEDAAVDSLHASAGQFITMFHNENRAGPPDRRLCHVHREIEATGTYWHTPEELAFGARVAWRNSGARCTGHLYWRSLQVRDRREVTAADDVAAESVTHLREATNGGRIRPTITVFAPDAPSWPGPRIRNPQLVRYAGHESADGVVGDPATVDVTRAAHALGWPGGRPPGRFDVLPLIVQEAGRSPTLHELPADAVLEVMIRHPDFAWFAELGLRWYAVPVISDMCLDIGGVQYPAAPFNGWYMCTEIVSRDLGDAGRYDQLPLIARQLGLAADRDGDRAGCRDLAMNELSLAVLHSFAASGVTISDHHTEAARFLQHMQHRQNTRQTPSFYRHPAPPGLIGLSRRNALGAAVPAVRRHSPPSVAEAPLIGVPQGRFLE